MNLRIASWNVRGLNEQDKRLWVRNLILNWKADIVYLQETKLELINRGVICSLWGAQHVDWLYLGSVGALGGVLLMWDNRVVDKVEEAVVRFSVSCKFKMWWIILFRHSLVFMDPIVIETEVSYGRTYLAYVVGGMCLSVWEVILMWCGFFLNVLVLQIHYSYASIFSFYFRAKLY